MQNQYLECETNLQCIGQLKKNSNAAQYLSVIPTTKLKRSYDFFRASTYLQFGPTCCNIQGPNRGYENLACTTNNNNNKTVSITNSKCQKWKHVFKV